MATNFTPRGCGPNVDSLYYNLCDMNAVWGIVLEAFAAAGIVFSIVLFISLLASLPFMQSKNRKSAVAVNTFFLIFTAGLFCLTFAFIVGKDFSTCASRRFLFGVFFGGCFACLLMQCVRLNILARQNSSPQAWVICLGALGLWLVEVVINTEWLIITVARYPLGPLSNTTATGRATAVPCNIANKDFVMALIYVMTLILAVFVASLAIMAGKYNETGGPTWDDPTLAIALVANAWAFVILYIIPQTCCLTGDEESQEVFGEELYPNRGVGYETILKEHTTQNMFMENKAFSMDEANQASKPVSPYSGYTGQLRSSVYQPTELALITKAVGNPHPDACDMVIPRASAHSAASSESSTPSTHPRIGNTPYTQTNGNSGNGLHRTSQW
ncbi:G-protein coupled receptor family C group 5 member C Retinoic acid-induced gene 3 protein [Larimichthys crocea]|uniref:G-protein coupled receptor family C group 5 member C Retinoic acid-induced gene 3 protein n=1 Tax=Larimichthys crocea TaxID=215358 RepID=A0A6G0HXV6_LARCR|nr:G-protein coupled receptor family C group 5 member C Retinoic acid-induced gene 3 protein [Larimichthys crocea]